MSIFIDQNTKVLVQGMTGKEGSYWSTHMLEMGTQIVAGVTPGKEGNYIEHCPIYHTVRRAVAEHTIDATILFVPSRFVKDAVYEALDAGIRKIVTIADGIPLHEMAQIRQAALSSQACIVGGNTSGVISPGKAMIGMFPYWIDRVYKPGKIGVMTRSGSLTNEIAAMVVKAGFGLSTLVGIGGDPIPGTRMAEMLTLFEQDPDTDAVVLIGELGGTMEEEVAEMVKNKEYTKPLVAFLGGRTAPEGKRMGHAGAIVSGGKGKVSDKIAALTGAGALVADKPSQIGELLYTFFGTQT